MSYPVYNSIFDYIRAVVYNLYKSISSTGAAMVLKKVTVTKVLLPIEIHVTDTLWASGGAQTHTFNYVSLPGDDVLCWLLFSFLLSAFPALLSPKLFPV